jgi:hypothetical protein
MKLKLTTSNHLDLHKKSFMDRNAETFNILLSLGIILKSPPDPLTFLTLIGFYEYILN